MTTATEEQKHGKGETKVEVDLYRDTALRYCGK